MRTKSRDLPADCTIPVAICMIIFASVAGAGVMGGYWLMQPRVFPNVGLAAYEPPPATRLIPLPRKMDAPELADLPPAPVEAVSAQPQPSGNVEQNTVAANAKPVVRRAKPKPHRDDPAFAYAYGERWGGERRSYGDRWDRSWSSRGGWNGW